MTDFDWAVGETSVRAVSCQGKEDDRLSEVDIWKVDHCSDHAKLIKRNIQDKEYMVYTKSTGIHTTSQSTVYSNSAQTHRSN